MLSSRGAASVRICTLLDKPERRAPGVTIKADYFGFTIGNEFVVGYGLDYAENIPQPALYRRAEAGNLPKITEICFEKPRLLLI